MEQRLLAARFTPERPFYLSEMYPQLWNPPEGFMLYFQDVYLNIPMIHRREIAYLFQGLNIFCVFSILFWCVWFFPIKAINTLAWERLKLSHILYVYEFSQCTFLSTLCPTLHSMLLSWIQLLWARLLILGLPSPDTYLTVPSGIYAPIGLDVLEGGVS